MPKIAKLQLNEFEHQALLKVLNNISEADLKASGVDDGDFDLLYNAVKDCVLWEDMRD